MPRKKANPKISPEPSSAYQKYKIAKLERIVATQRETIELLNAALERSRETMAVQNEALHNQADLITKLEMHMVVSKRRDHFPS